MSDLRSNRFAIWQEEHNLFRVEYQRSVLEELRAEAVRGLHGIGKGGVEVGGVLFGTRLGSLTRILAWRPIPCEHAMGPQFALSPKDEEGVRALLESFKKDPELRELQAVGWFVSHVRGEPTITASESEVHSRFFPDSWQWLLIVQPSRFGDAEVTFCIPEAGEPGKLSRLVPALPISPAPLKSSAAKSKLEKKKASSVGDQPIHVRKPRQIGGWMAWGLLHLALLGGTGYLALRTFKPGFGWQSLFPAAPVEPVHLLSLHARPAERPGAIQVRWDATADRVRRADRGEIAVLTQQGESKSEISSTTVKEGAYTTPVTPGPVMVTLRLFAANEEIAKEVTRVRIP